MNFIVLDTETTNGFDDPICYDVGWAVMNDVGEILATRSFVVADIFLNEKELMDVAFYKDKFPQYVADIADKKRELRRFKTIHNILWQDCRKYNIIGISAHNMNFDYRSCTKTQRWLTSSKYRFFFPYGVELWDTLKMARQTFGKDDTYKAWCVENGFAQKNGSPRLTAEILYRYISNNPDFVESHTGLEDVMIEKDIFFACLEMNPDVDKKCFK